MAKQSGGKLQHDPKLLLFVAELALNGGNASAAAREVGWSPEKGRRLVAASPQLRATASRAVAHVGNEVIREWKEMHAEARRRIGELMHSADEPVALRAAIYVIERVEGKTVQPIRDDTPRAPMESVMMRFVSSLLIYKGFSFAQAYAYAEQHPDEVEEWGRRKGLIPGVAEA
jgi:hypothetical protein